MRISDWSSDVCSSDLLERRFSETRRRHPLEDRPAADGIAREREMMESLRRWAEHVVDTTNYSSNDLQQEIRQRFAEAEDDEPALNILSFGFARGLPRHADLVFAIRYPRNPHSATKQHPGTGLEAGSPAYIIAH